MKLHISMERHDSVFNKIHSNFTVLLVIAAWTLLGPTFKDSSIFDILFSSSSNRINRRCEEVYLSGCRRLPPVHPKPSVTTPVGARYFPLVRLASLTGLRQVDTRRSQLKNKPGLWTLHKNTLIHDEFNKVKTLYIPNKLWSNIRLMLRPA